MPLFCLFNLNWTRSIEDHVNLRATFHSSTQLARLIQEEMRVALPQALKKMKKFLDLYVAKRDNRMAMDKQNSQEELKDSLGNFNCSVWTIDEMSQKLEAQEDTCGIKVSTSPFSQKGF